MQAASVFDLMPRWLEQEHRPLFCDRRSKEFEHSVHIFLPAILYTDQVGLPHQLRIRIGDGLCIPPLTLGDHDAAFADKRLHSLVLFFAPDWVDR